jgi:hypothetical protein
MGIAGNPVFTGAYPSTITSTGTMTGSGSAAIAYPNKYKVEFAQIALTGLIASDANCLFTNPELAAKAFDIAEAMYTEALKRGLA